MAKKQANIEGMLNEWGEKLQAGLTRALEMAFRPASISASVAKFATALHSSLGETLGRGVRMALAPVSGAISVFATATSREMQQVRSFVEKANPAAVFQFDRALDDLAGTLGQILTPILNSVTRFIREFADVMQGMKPLLAPVIQTIGITIDALTKLIAPLSGLLVPVLEILNGVLTNLVIPAIELFTEALKGMADVFHTVTLGLFEAQKATSYGAAVRPAAYSKIEDIGKRTTLAAIQGATVDHQKQMVEEQKKTNGILTRLVTFTFGKRIGNAYEREVKAMKEDTKNGIGPLGELTRWIDAHEKNEFRK